MYRRPVMRSGRPQVAQDGEHPAVVGLRRRQQELAEDARPRFHGRSTPLECGWPYATAKSAAWVGPDRRSFATSVARNCELAARCAARADLLPHASTRNVARDLDAVRAALGEPRLSAASSSASTPRRCTAGGPSSHPLTPPPSSS